jgi:hypothetical protein
MMEAASTSEMLLNFYHTTQHCIPEDSHLWTEYCFKLLNIYYDFTWKPIQQYLTNHCFSNCRLRVSIGLPTADFKYPLFLICVHMGKVLAFPLRDLCLLPDYHYIVWSVSFVILFNILCLIYFQTCNCVRLWWVFRQQWFA